MSQFDRYQPNVAHPYLKYPTNPSQRCSSAVISKSTQYNPRTPELSLRVPSTTRDVAAPPSELSGSLSDDPSDCMEDTLRHYTGMVRQHLRSYENLGVRHFSVRWEKRGGTVMLGLGSLQALGGVDQTASSLSREHRDILARAFGNPVLLGRSAIESQQELLTPLLHAQILLNDAYNAMASSVYPHDPHRKRRRDSPIPSRESAYPENDLTSPSSDPRLRPLIREARDCLRQSELMIHRLTAAVAAEEALEIEHSQPPSSSSTASTSTYPDGSPLRLSHPESSPSDATAPAPRRVLAVARRNAAMCWLVSLPSWMSARSSGKSLYRFAWEKFAASPVWNLLPQSEEEAEEWDFAAKRNKQRETEFRDTQRRRRRRSEQERLAREHRRQSERTRSEEYGSGAAREREGERRESQMRRSEQQRLERQHEHVRERNRSEEYGSGVAREGEREWRDSQTKEWAEQRLERAYQLEHESRATSRHAGDGHVMHFGRLGEGRDKKRKRIGDEDDRRLNSAPP
ncbi:MAG: hypothetical protein M1831_003660 [Alyxoria varia]|nr:MAG: hypothetical protein M1831_003660 [Alyxoria varia]